MDRRSIAAAALIALLPLSAAHAQGAASLLPGIPGLSLSDIANMPDAPRRAGCAVKSGQASQALAAVQAKLKIGPSQQAAWAKAVAAVNEAIAPLAAECDRPPDPPGSWAATFSRIRGDAALAAAMSKIESAGNDLYASLSPTQQQQIQQAAQKYQDKAAAVVQGLMSGGK